MRHQRRYAVILLAVLLAGCSNRIPPNLSPDGIKTWQAAQAATVVNTVMRTAVNLHDSKLLSFENTDRVIDLGEVAIVALRETPQGWKAVTVAFLDQVAVQVDADGKTQLAAWLKVAAIMVEEIGS